MLGHPRYLRTLLAFLLFVPAMQCNDGGSANEDENSDSETDGTDSNTSETDTDTTLDYVDFDKPNSLALDMDGNIYVLGNSEYSWNGPGGQAPLHEHSRVIETESMCSNDDGCADVFILKLAGDGTYQWHTFFGVYSHGENGHSLAIDNSGNLVAMGSSPASWDGPSGQTPKDAHPGVGSQFVTKFTAQGEYLWHTFHAGRASHHDNAVATDSNGNIYFLGNPSSPTTGPAAQAPLNSFVEGVDSFAYATYNLGIHKLNGDGVYQWHTFLGDRADDEGTSMLIDSNDALYVAGFSMGDWLGPAGEPPLRPYESEEDIFIVKVNGDGAYQWHTFYGGEDNSRDFSSAIMMDSVGDLFVTGYEARLWVGAEILPPREDYGTGFLLKLDPNGVYQWHTQGIRYDGMSYSHTDGAVGADGSVYLSSGCEMWNNSPGNQDPLHDHTNDDDSCLFKLDGDGMYQWHTYYGADDSLDVSKSVAVGTNGNIVMAGYAELPWALDDTPEPLNGHSGSKDIFVMSLGSDGSYQWHTFWGTSESQQ